MKSIFESPESFEAYATVDYCLWYLAKIEKEIPNGPIDTADKLYRLKNLMTCLTDMIRAKRYIGKSVYKEMKLLKKLKAMRPSKIPDGFIGPA